MVHSDLWTTRSTPYCTSLLDKASRLSYLPQQLCSDPFHIENEDAITKGKRNRCVQCQRCNHAPRYRPKYLKIGIFQTFLPYLCYHAQHQRMKRVHRWTSYEPHKIDLINNTLRSYLYNIRKKSKRLPLSTKIGVVYDERNGLISPEDKGDWRMETTQLQ